MYPSSEHAYQAAKTENLKIRRWFTDPAVTPAEAKAAGKNIVLRSNWEKIKVNVMRKILYDKFSPSNAWLYESLIETSNLYLEETNTWKDTFWGVYHGVGQNWLGKILMEVRFYYLSQLSE